MKHTNINFNDPIIKEALRLAQAFSNHCATNNLPQDFMADGVAYDAYFVIMAAKEEGYIAGKVYERARIATLLGVDH